MSGGGGFLDAKKWNKITDPLNIHKGKAGKWADPLGLIAKQPEGESAADRAQRMEEERQARISQTQGRINQIFDDPNRAGDIRDVVNAVRERDLGDLNRQKAESDRGLRFALARGSLLGGSTQRDQQELLGEQHSRGLINVEQRALGAGAELEARDQDARARLIALATSGLDATTGAQQAAAAMKSNLEGSRASAMGQALGDQFGTAAAFIKEAKDSAQRRRANQDAYGRLALYSAPNQNPYGG